MSNEIHLAVEEAYRVFGQYHLSNDIDFAARVSVSVEENARLRSVLETVALRSLPVEAIEAYFEYISAAHYGGKFNAFEFRYFLPRGLELLAFKNAERYPWLRDDIERSLTRVSAYSQWPPAEVASINRLLRICEE